jgi:vacuolar-type H+-ATPase subunit H
VTEYEDDLDELADLSAAPVPTPYHGAETEEILLQLHDIVDAARPVPLSASSMISKEEVLELLDEALARLPEELRAARWLLKEREEYLARVRHEGDEILDQARTRAERMVQRTEVVKAAEARAYQIVDNAEAEARRLHHEVEDFCDQKLASFEIVLERTMKLVASGRQKLQGTNLVGEVDEEHPLDHPLDLPPPPDAPVGGPEGAYDADVDAGYDEEFYDQDDAS